MERAGQDPTGPGPPALSADDGRKVAKAMDTFKEGDRVKYSGKFLRGLGADYETGARRGTVKAVREPYRLAVRVDIEWDDCPGEVKAALPINIMLADRPDYAL